MKIKKVCLHNKSNTKQTSFMAISNTGNCHKCIFDETENKKCQRFYPITIMIEEKQNENN